MHILPVQGQDLVAPAPGQHQKADRSRRRRRYPALGLQRAQHLPQPAELIFRQEPLALALPVLDHKAARIAALRSQAPDLGLIDHPRQRDDHLVRHGRDMAQPVVQVGHMLAPDRGNGQLAELGQNVLAHHTAVQLRRARFAAHRDILAIVPAPRDRPPPARVPRPPGARQSLLSRFSYNKGCIA